MVAELFKLKYINEINNTIIYQSSLGQCFTSYLKIRGKGKNKNDDHNNDDEEEDVKKTSLDDYIHFTKTVNKQNRHWLPEHLHAVEVDS